MKQEVVEKDLVKEESKVESVAEEFTHQQALQILMNAIKLAQKRGAFELEETEIILKAYKKFTLPTV